MASAYKCDRCGRYYKDSTSGIGYTLSKPSGWKVDLCKKCKDSLTKWFEKYMESDKDKSKCFYEEHVEWFVKRCSFNNMAINSSNQRYYMSCYRFREALEEFFNYCWDPTRAVQPDTVEGFVQIHSLMQDSKHSTSKSCLDIEDVKRALKLYFNYDWRDNLYDQY